MHMSDGLVSPPVAAIAGAAAVALIAIAAVKVRKSERTPSIALMGIMGAFIFAAQMLNFSIPGTGSSGHIIGGVLLAAILGPWAAFLTLAAVLVIQCFVFADGGLMALGCNIINMGAMTCLVAYPLIYRPLVGRGASTGRIMGAATAACVAGLELGALLVTFETEFSGITLLPIGKFLMFMVPIHLAIGVVEGVATGAVVSFVSKSRPELLQSYEAGTEAQHGLHTSRGIASALAIFAVIAAVFGLFVSRYASSDPDGLEWSIERVAGSTELPAEGSTRAVAAKVQESTATFPDYDNKYSGLIGGGLVVVLAGGVSALLRAKSKKDGGVKN